MQAVLENVISTFDDAGVELPLRQYVTTGQSTFDTEQVTVSFQQLYIGPPGDQAQSPQRGEAPRTCVLLIEIVRCIPGMSNSGAPPDAALVDASVTQQAIDAWLLLEAATKQIAYLGILADVSPSAAQGNYQAMSMSVISAVQ